VIPIPGGRGDWRGVLEEASISGKGLETGRPESNDYLKKVSYPQDRGKRFIRGKLKKGVPTLAMRRIFHICGDNIKTRLENLSFQSHSGWSDGTYREVQSHHRGKIVNHPFLKKELGRWSIEAKKPRVSPKGKAPNDPEMIDDWKKPASCANDDNGGS